MYNIEELVETARRAGASDVHIVCGLPPKFRLDGQLESMFEGRLSEEDCEQLCRDLARESYDKLEYTGELDFSRELRGIRCRCHCFPAAGQGICCCPFVKREHPQTGFPWTSTLSIGIYQTA